MNDILQNIEKVFNDNKLIGNHDFTEEEYSLMLENVRKLSFGFTEKDSYKLIFATLVEIAKRWRQSDISNIEEENSGYWDYVFKILFSLDIDQQLCQKYRNVIGSLGEDYNIPIATSGHKFYATIMMHAFAPKNSIYSFFDLCYNVFKKDLDFGFTSDDEWLCEVVIEQMKNVLWGGYREDKLVSIGSSAYSIKIGLRSFVLNENLTDEFNKFLKDTFYNINKLFNREIIEVKTRLELFIVDWWRNKTETEKLASEIIYKKRVPTVSKQDIAAKYIKNDNEVFLCIPSIRLDDVNGIMKLSIIVNENLFYSEEMITKRGELVISTKPIDFRLNELLHSFDLIKIRVEIRENDTLIFDSEKNKTTSLYREFILFDNEKEIFSQINKPNNYFIYSKDIDLLKIVPDDLYTCGKNLYNIYPKAGESIIGEKKQIFFVDKTKTAILGINPCLIGSIADVEWILEDFFCVVYKNAVKLMIPKNFNLKALELIIDNKHYKLDELNYERIELNCYQFGLKILGLLSDCYPTKITLYSYEKEKILLEETIIVLPNLDIEFNYPFYYGDFERIVSINNGRQVIKLSWNIQDNEVICPLEEGFLVVKVPYLRWRINDKDWRKEPINKKLWYKDFLHNGDLLEIDNPKEDEEIKLLVKIDGQKYEIQKNHSAKFEIGRAIYTNEGKKDLCVYCSNPRGNFELFNIATKEHFIENPLNFYNGKIYWNVENTFVGNKDNNFLLDIGPKNLFRNKIDCKNKEILSSIKEDIYKVIVKVKDKNIFAKEEKWDSVFEGRLIVGKPEKFRFKNKYIIIERINTAFSKDIKESWITPSKNYVIRDLEYLEVQEGEQTYDYYLGKLKIAGEDGQYLDYLENENGQKDKINPVRIELRDNKSFWLKAGYDENDVFFNENLMINTINKLCFINSIENKVAILYKFKEEEYV
jgi:hypothetical protein